MPTSEFFEQYGFFSVKNFLDRDFCENLCKEIKTAPNVKGTLVKPHEKKEVVDEEIKKRLETTKISSELNETVVEKLVNLKNKIADHYDLELSGIQKPKYSIYQTGDYYKTHVDSNIQEDAADFLKQRKVSVIIFLNEESEIKRENSYSGGNLTFYGLTDNEVFKNFGFPLQSEPGMLITFPPHLPHEVTPVISGTRYAVTTWYI